MSKDLVLEKALAVVFNSNTGRNKLVRLMPTNQNADFNAVVQNNQTETPDQESFLVDKSDILAVLHEGLATDKPQTVLGVKVEPYKGRLKVSHASIILYREISPAETKRLKKASEVVYNRMAKKGLDYLFPLTVELKNCNGKSQGYCRIKKGDESFIVGLTPGLFSGEGEQSIEYIVIKEMMLPLWEYYIPEEQKAKWVSLYTNYSLVKEISPQSLASMCNDLKSEGSVKGYTSNCDEEDKIIFRQALKWCKQTFHIDTKSLDLLLDNGFDIAKIWPPSPLHLSSVDTPVSVEASKSPFNLFASSMAAYINKMDLSEKIEKRCKFTLKALKGRA